MDYRVDNRLQRSLALRRWLAGGVIVVLLAGIALASGQLSAHEQQPGWTLRDLVVTALDRNPGLAAARTGAEAAAEDIAVARGERFPRLDAVGLGEVFPFHERLLIPRHGFRGDHNTFESGIVNYGLEVTLPLYTSGRIEHGISLAEARTEAARSRAELTRNELIFNVASGYYTGLRLQEVIAAQEAALASLKESLRVAELQRAVGRIAPLDILRLKTRSSQSERDLAGARNTYAQVLEILKELINSPPEEPLNIAGKLAPAPTAVALEALRDKALEQRPDIAALRHEVDAQREAIGVAEARLGPVLDFKGGFRGVTGSDDGTTQGDATLFLQFRVPLYEGGVLRAQTRKARTQLREAEQRLQQAARRALAEVERAVLDLKASEPRIHAARHAVEQGEESLRVEREKFEQGRGTSNDLLLAEEALLRARTEFAVALADSQIAQAALRFAVGEDPVAIAAAASEPGREDD